MTESDWTTDHRPWPVPRSPWIMAQRWEDLLFAHWPAPARSLRDRIPPQLSLDTFDDSAWLGITPFRMSGVRPRGLPALPGLSAFPEINVRTYVRAREKPGVFFFSLDAGNSIAVALARRLFHLPYHHAAMSVESAGDGISYRSRRLVSDAPAEFEADYEPFGDQFRSQPGTLEHFLTERYCLYAAEGKAIYRAEIHHRPWPLRRAQVEIRRNTLAEPFGLTLDAKPPVLHFAKRLEVRVWAPRLVDPSPC